MSSKLLGKEFVSASTVYWTLIVGGYRSYKRTVKPGLNDPNKEKRLAWYIEHLEANRWDLKRWKDVI